MQRPAPTRATKVLYGLGSVAFGVKDNGFSFFLLLYYNQVLGLPEGWVGLGILLALVIDGLIDPIVGHVSDHLHSRWGRRHPFMYAAALPVGVSYWLLWSPPAGLGPGALFTYFLVVSVLVRICISLYEIPSASLAPELTTHYDERTSILGWRYFFGWWGGLTVAVLAYAVFLQPDAAHPVGVLNPDGYRRYGLAASCIMVAAILISAAGTHAYIPHLRRPRTATRPGLAESLHELRETLSNPSFLAVFGTGVFASMATGLVAALTIYFNTYFWELDSNEISVLALGNFLSAAAAFLIAPPLSRGNGKKPAAILVSLAAIVSLPAPVMLRLAGLFPANQSPWLVPTLFVVYTVGVAFLIMSSILVTSMLADVVEDSEVATGRRSEGVFFAANALVQKVVSGIGILASTILLWTIGFPRGAKPGEVDPSVIRNLALSYVPVVVVLLLIAVAFLSAYRISRSSHEENLRKLGAAAGG